MVELTEAFSASKLCRLQIEVPEPSRSDHRAVVKPFFAVAIDLMRNTVALESRKRVLTHHTLASEGAIVRLLLITELPTPWFLMRQLHVDDLILQAKKAEVGLYRHLIGDPFSPSFLIQDALVVVSPRIGMTKYQNLPFWVY